MKESNKECWLPDTPDELTQILKDRIKLRSGWDIEEEWVVWVPGAVVALNLACKAVLSPGEIVVTPSLSMLLLKMLQKIWIEAW